MNRLFLFMTAVLFATTISAQSIHEPANMEMSGHKIEWWQDAKFGMFIHWGLYSVPAGKWDDNTNYGETIMFQAKIPVSTYSDLAKKFNPEKFVAEDWVKLAKAAGQKYIVIVTKHHDGFAMFKSNASSYNIVDATPYKRDPLKELAVACKKYDMKLGFYYSQAQDWYHPGGARYDDIIWDESQMGDMREYIDNIAIPQVKEILENYGEVAILWWDTPLSMDEKMCHDLADLLKPYPTIITNDRLGTHIGGDIETPEQYIPATGFPGRNWEVCMTMNGFWGYNSYDERWKSTKELLRMLIEIVSKGGNFLLNVGPTAEGVIPEICQQNLREIGEWLEINGEAIYGTKAGPFANLSYGRATRKGQVLYLHVFDWPKDGKIRVPISNKITKAFLLADPGYDLRIKPEKDRSVLSLPKYAPDHNASVVAIHFEGEPIVKPIPTLGKKIIISAGDSLIETCLFTDGDINTKWQAPSGQPEVCLNIDLGRPYTIQAVTLIQPYHKWEEEHELQFFEKDEWKPVFKNTTNERRGITASFNPVTSNLFRLIINSGNHAPMISEVMLFETE